MSVVPIWMIGVFLFAYTMRTSFSEYWRPSLLSFASWVSAGSAFLLTIYTFSVIGDLFDHKKGMGSDISELKKHPILSIALFLVTFSCITYFMGFAFAFSDKSAEGHLGKRSLFSDSRYYPGAEDLGSGDIDLSRFGPSCFRIDHESRRSSSEATEEYTVELIVIEDSEGPEIDSGLLEHLIEVGSDVDMPFKTLEIGRERIHPDVSPHQGDEEPELDGDVVVAIKRINTCALWQIYECIRRRGGSTSIRVRIEAYRTDSTMRSGSPITHYNLVWLRSRNTLDKLQGVLSDFPLENLPGEPDVELPLIPSTIAQPLSGQTLEALLDLLASDVGVNERNVRSNSMIEEARLAPIRLSFETIPGRMPKLSGNKELSLLDYMYFSVYTVTTTGYGDIVPIKPHSRFLATLCNMFEVFYFVILFNLLLALFLEPR